MEQKAPPKTFIMPSNGQHSASSSPWVQNLLMPLLVIGVGAAITLALKLDSNVAILNDRQIRDSQDKSEMKQDINEIKLDIRDLRDRSIREEKLQNQQKPPL